jgi:hypothetical protein
MAPRAVVLATIAAAALGAAATAGYFALTSAPAPQSTSATMPGPEPGLPAPAEAAPVSETEALLAPETTADPAAAAGPDAANKATKADDATREASVEKPRKVEPSRPARQAAPSEARAETPPRQPSRERPPVSQDDTPVEALSRDRSQVPAADPAPRDESSTTASSRVDLPPVEAPAPPVRRTEELVVPADSVIGLQLEDTVSSKTARVEQRVEARVSRDVRVDGTVVVPAGSRAQGEVTLVEPGGKFKDRARLGIRFHTLVLADGSTVPIQTETVYREGEGVGGKTAARIGGSAVGGAIIGAILGGGKGAAIGAAAGAGAGTAATAATGRSEATLQAGSTVTVRLTNPATVTVER